MKIAKALALYRRVKENIDNEKDQSTRLNRNQLRKVYMEG